MSQSQEWRNAHHPDASQPGMFPQLGMLVVRDLNGKGTFFNEECLQDSKLGSGEGMHSPLKEDSGVGSPN